jgi:CheY-like chemotaxis protein
VFTITLPINATQATSEPEAERRPSKTTNDAGARVLLVDDDPQIHDLIGTMLEREGYRVEHASDGQEALTRARELRPSVILLDVMMPKMDGWTVLGKLKEDPDLATIPVVIVSLLDERPLGMSLGAADVLSKPVDRAQLVSMVRTYAGNGTVRILVVDDNADDRTAICRTLRDQDYEVIEASDGVEAIEWLESHPAPAVILLDLVMSGMDGFAVLDRIRHHPGLQSSKVIILSAKDLSLGETSFLRERGALIVPKGADARTALLEALEALSL